MATLEALASVGKNREQPLFLYMDRKPQQIAARFNSRLDRNLELPGKVLFIFTIDHGPHSTSEHDPATYGGICGLRRKKPDLDEGGIRELSIAS